MSFSKFSSLFKAKPVADDVVFDREGIGSTIETVFKLLENLEETKDMIAWAAKLSKAKGKFIKEYAAQSLDRMDPVRRGIMQECFTSCSIYFELQSEVYHRLLKSSYTEFEAFHNATDSLLRKLEKETATLDSQLKVLDITTNASKIVQKREKLEAAYNRRWTRKLRQVDAVICKIFTRVSIANYAGLSDAIMSCGSAVSKIYAFQPFLGNVQPPLPYPAPEPFRFFDEDDKVSETPKAA